jgi:hypothetical protein
MADHLFLVIEDPGLPLRRPVLHRPKDDFGHLQARLSNAHCGFSSSDEHNTPDDYECSSVTYRKAWRA